MNILTMVLRGAVPVIAILVAAAFVVPVDAPFLPRQIALSAIGVAGIAIAERRVFGNGWRRIAAALGISTPRPRAVLVAGLVSLPMWLFPPIYGRLVSSAPPLVSNWPEVLLGVILLNGVAEEVIHRGFIFGHLRETRPFRLAATMSGAVFAAQHAYLLFTLGPLAGLASMAVAMAVAFPLAFLYEEGGNSVGAPLILHTSSNAPMLVFAVPAGGDAVILPHMATVVLSMSLTFAFGAWLRQDRLNGGNEHAAHVH